MRAPLQRAMDAGEGILRLTPTWVPRSFLHPGKRIKLHPQDWYAYGAHRGGIDERWFGSTTEAANDGRIWHEGLSFIAFEGEHFLLRDAVAELGDSNHRSGHARDVSTLAGLLEVLRQHGADPSSHASVRRACGVGRAGGKAGKLLLLAANEQRRQQLRLHLHGAGTGNDERPDPPVPGELG